MKVSVLQDPDGPHSSSMLLHTCTDSSLCTLAQVQYHMLCAPNPVLTCTPLPRHAPLSPVCSPGSLHFLPLPTNLNPCPNTTTILILIPESKVQPFSQPRPPQITASWGPGPSERKKERKREEKQKERGKPKNETGPKGQWCLELSQCITMNMDSIKLRSAC